MSIRVAAAQLALGKGSYRKAVDDTLSLIHEAARLEAKIVCLPEHWLLEYREEGYGVIEQLSEAARKDHLFIVSGANYTLADNTEPPEVRIRSHLISPEGKTIGQQDKIHLFRSEKDIAKPGDRFEVFNTPLGKVGIAICYDNVFPETARTLTLNGADILIVPSRITSEGIAPWLLYLRTRALENRIPVIAPNVFHPQHFLGNSVIIDLELEPQSKVVFPKIVASAKPGERVIVANVDVARARELRKDRLSDRQPGAYSDLRL